MGQLLRMVGGVLLVGTLFGLWVLFFGLPGGGCAVAVVGACIDGLVITAVCFFGGSTLFLVGEVLVGTTARQEASEEVPGRFMDGFGPLIGLPGEWQGITDNEIWDARFSFTYDRMLVEVEGDPTRRGYYFPFDAINWFSVDPANLGPPMRRVAEKSDAAWVLHGSVSDENIADRWRFLMPGSKMTSKVARRLGYEGVRDTTPPDGRQLLEASDEGSRASGPRRPAPPESQP